ncbi:threonine ammonia-lyase [Ensifer sp. B1-9]|uniref:threonine ammonia-lyase n=1 Tax=Ensifer sp. B1-9 TaxID=3141455 RepID=UPI003D1FC0EB
MDRLHAKINEAASLIRDFVLRTPLLESDTLNDELGLRVLVKAECLQKTGSFKARGALNFALRLGAVPDAHFVGFSSGNHAQGLAYAARIVGARATVLMPASAPVRKIAGTRALGAGVEILTDFFASRERRAAEFIAEGAILLPPFDHEDIVVGQGTVGLEVAAQAARRKIQPDAFFVPASGGGLLAGSASAVRDTFPRCRIVAVEPHGFDDFARSLAAGRRVTGEAGASTLCDGLMSPQPGKVPFAIAKSLAPDFDTVTDAQVTNAVRILFDRFNLVVEPSGAAAFASLLSQAKAMQGTTAVVVASGGNIDQSLFTRLLGEPSSHL